MGIIAQRAGLICILFAALIILAWTQLERLLLLLGERYIERLAPGITTHTCMDEWLTCMGSVTCMHIRAIMQVCSCRTVVHVVYEIGRAAMHRSGSYLVDSGCSLHPPVLPSLGSVDHLQHYPLHSDSTAGHPPVHR